jgi:hypothetical protein
MALVVTTLNGAITQGAQRLVLTAFTNPSTGAMSADTVLLVDGEKMTVADATLTPTLTVTRGDYGTSAIAHNTLAPVVYGLTSDFSQDLPAFGIASNSAVVSYGVSGAITPPTKNTTIYLTKATAAAMTLAAPAADATCIVTVVSLTAAAHTITYTAGFYQNTTSSDVVTYPSTSGACWNFQAKNGLWNATLGGGTTGGVTGPA